MDEVEGTKPSTKNWKDQCIAWRRHLVSFLFCSLHPPIGAVFLCVRKRLRMPGLHDWPADVPRKEIYFTVLPCAASRGTRCLWMIWPLIQRIRVVLDHLRLNPPINYNSSFRNKFPCEGNRCAFWSSTQWCPRKSTWRRSWRTALPALRRPRSDARNCWRWPGNDWRMLGMWLVDHNCITHCIFQKLDAPELHF